MKTIATIATSIAVALALLVLTPTAAAAQFPGEPKPPPQYDPVADMRYTFAIGAPDAAVRAAQRVLREYGYYVGQADGILGPAERRALWNFQRDSGLRLTARLDVVTAATLGITQVATAAEEAPAAASPSLDPDASPFSRPFDGSVEAP